MSKGAMSGVDITQDVMDTWQDMHLRRKYKFIIYKIKQVDQAKGSRGPKVIDVVYKEEDHSKQWDDFLCYCVPDDSFFGVFDFEYLTKASSLNTKPLLVAWNPDTCDIKTKMLYASSKDAIKKRFGTGLLAEIQASDLEDLRLESIKTKVDQVKL